MRDTSQRFHLTSLRFYVKVLRDDLSLSRVKGLAFFTRVKNYIDDMHTEALYNHVSRACAESITKRRRTQAQRSQLVMK